MEIKNCLICDQPIHMLPWHTPSAYGKRKYHTVCYQDKKNRMKRPDKVYKKPQGGDDRNSYKYHLARQQAQI